MAACHPEDGDPGEPDKITPSCLSQPLKSAAGGAQNSAVASSVTSEDIKLKKAETLLRSEADTLKEESSSGDDARDLRERCRNKKFQGGRRHHHHHNHSHHSQQEASAAARSSTGGSLGSLHDLSDTKQVKQSPGTQNQGVASRFREGGSCGNLSRGSFETRKVGGRRGTREATANTNRASTSQREGGSLQNLSKSEGGPGESKKLHKSGSLSQVCSEPNSGARSKNRRQKTSSESSGRHETSSAIASTPTTAAAADSRATFPPEGVGGRSLSGIASPDSGNNDDSMSDVVSEEENTEEEVEPLRGGGERPGSESAAPEESGIELQIVTCHRSDHDTIPHHHDSTNASPTEVDKGINFSLSGPKNSTCVNSVFKEDKSTSKEEECGIKRKPMGNRSDTAGGESKSSSLDENGNPVVTPSPGGLLGGCGVVAGQGEQQHQRTTSSMVMSSSRKPTLKDVSRFDRVKARNDKKKAYREKDIVVVEHTPGFRGDQDLNDILKFIGAEVEDPATSTRNKRKHNKNKKEDEKGRKEDDKTKKDEDKTKKEEEKEVEGGSIKKSKNRIVDKDGEEEIRISSSSDAARENNKRNREEDSRKGGSHNHNNNAIGKKTKNNNVQEGKKSGGGKKGISGRRELRESSSMEDLVSMSRKSDEQQEIRKQMTVDDGDMSSRNRQDKLSRNLRSDMPFMEKQRCGKSESDVDSVHQKTSEFVADFYSVGDSFLATDNTLNSPSPSGGGDFEVVSNKKRSKRSRTTYSQGSGGRTSEQDRYSTYGDDGYRFSRLNHFRGQKHGDRPHINFSECPRTPHEGSFLARWSQMGVGERYGGERYGAQATTSAPHSEDSNSDGDDSVHSMPVPSITPRPDVRKPPPSSDSTPQASYANIAKLAASANRAQMKRMSPAVSTPREQGDSSQTLDTTTDSHVSQESSKLPPLTETHSTSILDDNFPSLAESLGVTGNSSLLKSAEPSLVKSAEVSVTVVKTGEPRAVKAGEPRTSSSDSGVSETGSTGVCSDVLPDSDGQVEGGSVEKQSKPTNPHHNSNQHSHNHYFYKHQFQTSPALTHVPPPEFTQHHPPPPSHVSRSLAQNYAVIPPPTASFTSPPPPPNTYTTHPPPNTYCTYPPPSTYTTHPPPPLPHVSYTTQPPPVTYNKQPPPHPATYTSQPPPTTPFTTQPPPAAASAPAALATQPYPSKPPNNTSDVTVKQNKAIPQPEVTNGLPADDKQSSGSNTRCRRNGSAAGVGSRKLEPAVVFTDNARFHHSTNDFCKWFQAPKNDKISFNYEELIRHFSKTWEVTMQQMEKDPKNIQYWRAAGDCSGSRGKDDA
ncbi:hypothetical protein Pcinc_034851 [Petrolisthes cinctipes]|uniref:Uncharacterized protein n=1 Tax=Petrolisthes cinctipes TaxID=88211 RepID=A0AAE1BW86_PETCI|nr:hypothetical protein Pcinc_035594 [Petrolisthes cinctipes]KAK3858987.1 hypothetical protein Pcinc_034851 [Petrolisthes cinctipes]